MKENRTQAPSYPIPQVDKILRHPILKEKEREIRPDIIAAVAKRVVLDYRTQKDSVDGPVSEEYFAKLVDQKLRQLILGNLTRVVNGTGVILSTNLGRAPLPEATVSRALEVLCGYSNLELDLESGKRGERSSTIEELLTLLTGCESALLVNNNAAAVLLTVTALAHGKEVVVSRGELIEIGGSFRLPEVIESAGAKLKEVGTTNRTRLQDYRAAIGATTGLLFKCHRSNFEITGFTEAVNTEALVALGKETSTVVVEDLGSGALIDLSKLGMRQEPTVADVISEGIDLVMFSGDKLLGGSQAGIICGKSAQIKKLRAHPIYRVLRADKLSIVLIEQILIQYLRVCPERFVPALDLAARSKEAVRERVDHFIADANSVLTQWQCQVKELRSAIGGGSLPGQTVDSFGFELTRTNENQSRFSADKLLKLLRKAPCPIIGMIQDDKLVIDFRTVLKSDEALLLQSLSFVDQCSKQANFGT